MSAVVLNQQSGSDQLYAGGLLTGARGVVCQKGGSGVNAGGPITALGVFTIADTDPAAPATVNASSFTTFAAQTGGGGLNPNQLQKYAYCDPRVSPAGVQQYENGRWVATATAPEGTNLSANATFCNSDAQLFRPLSWAAPFVGSFTCAAAPVVVPCAGITATSVVRIMLVAGSAAAFTAAAAAGITAPAITVQVAATTAAGTFTATGGEAGMIYNYEVLIG
jgi:hypothetical protein